MNGNGNDDNGNDTAKLDLDTICWAGVARHRKAIVCTSFIRKVFVHLSTGSG